MKSVTKSFSSYKNWDTPIGLTNAQRAGIYSIYVDGTTVGTNDYYGSTTVSKTLKGFGHVGLGNDKSSDGSESHFYLIVTDIGNNTGYIGSTAYLKYFAMDDTIYANANTTYGTGAFTGTITFYYFE